MDLSKEIAKQVREKRAEIQRLQKEVRGLEGALAALKRSPGPGRPAKKRTARAGKRAKRGENPAKVLRAMSKKPMAVKDISAKCGVKSPSINALLNNLAKAGKVVKRARGLYALKGKTLTKPARKKKANNSSLGPHASESP